MSNEATEGQRIAMPNECPVAARVLACGSLLTHSSQEPLVSAKFDFKV